MALDIAQSIKYIEVDASTAVQTYTLPALSGLSDNDEYVIKIKGTFPITVNPMGSDTIDLAASYSFQGDKATVSFRKNGADRSTEEAELQFGNELGYNPATNKIESGGTLTKNTVTNLSSFIRQWMASGATMTIDPTGDVNISTAATATTPNTNAGNNARFAVLGGASIFNNAGADGNQIVEFRTDKPRSIRQRLTGANTKTQVMADNNGAKWSFADQTNEDIAVFESNGTSNTSALEIRKALRLMVVPVSASYTIIDDGIQFWINTTSGPVTLTLCAPSLYPGRVIEVFHYAGSNPVTITTPSGTIQGNGGNAGASYAQKNNSTRYYLRLTTDGGNRLADDPNIDTHETTGLLTVVGTVALGQDDTFVIGDNSSSVPTLTINAAQSWKGRRLEYKAKATNSNNINISILGGGTIEGSTTLSLVNTSKMSGIVAKCDGTNWYILSQY